MTKQTLYLNALNDEKMRSIVPYTLLNSAQLDQARAYLDLYNETWATDYSLSDWSWYIGSDYVRGYEVIV